MRKKIISFFMIIYLLVVALSNGIVSYILRNYGDMTVKGIQKAQFTMNGFFVLLFLVCIGFIVKFLNDVVFIPKKRLETLVNADIITQVDINDNDTFSNYEKEINHTKKHFKELVSNSEKAIKWLQEVAGDLNKSTTENASANDELLIKINTVQNNLNNISTYLGNEIEIINVLFSHIQEIQCTDMSCKKDIEQIHGDINLVYAQIQEISANLVDILDSAQKIKIQNDLVSKSSDIVEQRAQDVKMEIVRFINH